MNENYTVDNSIWSHQLQIDSIAMYSVGLGIAGITTIEGDDDDEEKWRDKGQKEFICEAGAHRIYNFLTILCR